MAPRADDEEKKIAEAISSKWLGRPLALIEDGTIYGRELSESVRLLLEEVGITPVFTDNYRPSQNKQFGLVRRLERAGASHAFFEIEPHILFDPACFAVHHQLQSAAPSGQPTAQTVSRERQGYLF